MHGNPNSKFQSGKSPFQTCCPWHLKGYFCPPSLYIRIAMQWTTELVSCRWAWPLIHHPSPGSAWWQLVCLFPRRKQLMGWHSSKRSAAMFVALRDRPCWRNSCWTPWTPSSSYFILVAMHKNGPYRSWSFLEHLKTSRTDLRTSIHNDKFKCSASLQRSQSGPFAPIATNKENEATSRIIRNTFTSHRQ